MPKVNVQIKKKNINLSLVGRRGIRGQKGDKGDQGDPATNLVQSVNGKQGVIVLNYNDVGADQSGSATTALNSAKTYADSKVQDLDNELATVSLNVPALTCIILPIALTLVHAYANVLQDVANVSPSLEDKSTPDKST